MSEPFVVHCHVPSSGSGHLNRRLLFARYRQERVLQLYEAEYGTAQRLPLSRISWAMRCHAAAGHVPIGFFDRIYPAALHIIVLREPVARWLDALNAMLAMPEHPFHQRLGPDVVSLATEEPDACVRVVLEDRRILQRGTDVQTRLASGMARFGRRTPDIDDLSVALANLSRKDVLAGDYRTMDAFLTGLRDILPGADTAHRISSPKHSPARPPQIITPDMLTARTLEGIRAVNSFDLRLHDRFAAGRGPLRAAA